MAFDESLLRDEPSGFDESLLRDEEPIEITPPPTRPYGSFRRFADLPPVPPMPAGPTPEEWLSLPPEEQARIIDQLNLAETARLRREVLAPSRAGTIAREAVAGAGPALAAGAGFAAGAPLGAPLGPLGMIATGTGGAILAGSAASDIQDLAAQAIAPEDAARFQSLIQAGREEFPYSAVAGRLAGAIPSFQVSLPRTAMEVAKRSALGAGLASVPAVTEGRLPTGAELLEGAVGGVALGDPRLKALRVPITTTKGEPDASRIVEASPLHADVPAQSIQGAQEVPAQEGGARVLPPEEIPSTGRAVDDLGKVGEIDAKEAQKEGQAVRETVDQQPAPVIPDVERWPGATARGLELGKQRSVSELEAMLPDAQAKLDSARAAAQKRFDATKNPDHHPSRSDKVQNLALEKQYIEEGIRIARDLQQDKSAATTPPTTKPVEQAAPEVTPAAVTPEGPAPAVAEGRAAQTEPGRNVSPSGAAVGIAPPGTGLAQRIIEKFTSKEKGAAPPIKTDVTTPLPDFQEHNVSKGIFAQPFGWERIPILGAPLGGLRRAAGHINEAITTYWNEREIGKNITSSLANEYSWLDKPFQIVDGQIANIGAKPGQSRYISDVFEALQRDPTAYDLSPDQRKAFDAVQALEKDFNKLEKKYKLGKSVDQELEGGEGVSTFLETGGPAGEVGKVTQAPSYFPRIVTSRPEGSTGGLGRGKSVGAKAFFEKQRMFDTEAEGWAKGYKYEPSIVNRVATRAERLYKRIADKRLAEDKSLGGLSRKEQEAQLKASYAEELASGEMTDATISRMVDSLEQRGRVMQPAFYGKIFPEETAKAINKAFPQGNEALLNAAVSVNDAIRTLKTGYDWGVGQIQGLPLLSRFPHIWAKSQVNMLRAMASKSFLPEYVSKNIDAVREAAQSGISVGRLQDYMAGFGKGGILPRLGEALAPVPIIGKVAKGASAVTQSFGRGFGTFLDVAKIELWKAYSKHTPKDQWGDLAKSIDSVLMTSNLEASGVGPKRALAERALLFASSYYRGGLNLVGGAIMEKGISGSLMRQTIGALTLGGAAAFYGIGKALGMSDEDILRRFNPARSDFLSWRITRGDKTYEVGIGGFYRSMLRLVGDSVKTSIENMGNWLSLDPKKNPFVKWYRGHGGPAITTPWDQFTGKDYLGRETDLRSLGKSVVPLTLEKVTGGEGAPTPSIGELGASFVGLNVFPSQQPSTKETFVNIHNWMAKSEDPKVQAEFTKRQEEEYAKPYAPLRQALAANDIKAAGEAYTELLKTRKPKNIIQAIRPFSRDRDYVRHDKPLTGSKELERKFLESLSDEDRKLYDAAKKERMELWTRFQKVLEARKE